MTLQFRIWRILWTEADLIFYKWKIPKKEMIRHLTLVNKPFTHFTSSSVVAATNTTVLFTSTVSHCPNSTKTQRIVRPGRTDTVNQWSPALPIPVRPSAFYILSRVARQDRHAISLITPNNWARGLETKNHFIKSFAKYSTTQVVRWPRWSRRKLVLRFLIISVKTRPFLNRPSQMDMLINQTVR